MQLVEWVERFNARGRVRCTTPARPLCRIDQPMIRFGRQVGEWIKLRTGHIVVLSGDDEQMFGTK